MRRASQGISFQEGPVRIKESFAPPRGAVKTGAHLQADHQDGRPGGQTAERTARPPQDYASCREPHPAHRPGGPRPGGCDRQSSGQIRRGGGQGRHIAAAQALLRPCGGRRGCPRARGCGVFGRNPDRLTFGIFSRTAGTDAVSPSACGPAQPWLTDRLETGGRWGTPTTWRCMASLLAGRR